MGADAIVALILGLLQSAGSIGDIYKQMTQDGRSETTNAEFALIMAHKAGAEAKLEDAFQRLKAAHESNPS